MAVCPKCSYALVLLPKKRKYKCARCGRLHPQKLIDNKEFQRWNQKQRELTKEQIKQEFEEAWNICKPERKPRKKFTEEQRKQRTKESNRKNWIKNKVKISFQRRRYRQRHKDKINARDRKRTSKIRAHLRIRARQEWQKKKHIYNKNRREKNNLRKALATMGLKNNNLKPCKGISSSQMADFHLVNY